MGQRTALILGVYGQDGSYLAEFLWAKGYRVVGTSRDAFGRPAWLQGAAWEEADVRTVDVRVSAEIDRLIDTVEPDEVYNFAAYSTGSGMYDEPVAIGDVNGLAPVRILEAIRATGAPIRFCQASSSEMFRGTSCTPQDEGTPFAPVSPYGAAKLHAHHAVRIARQHHGIQACSAILFNHESPRRSASFVTRKVTKAAAAIKLGEAGELALGTLDARRDWSHARDIVEGMWLMLQSTEVDDYVLASGLTHSIADVCRIAFQAVGLDWERFVRVDPDFARSEDSVVLVGNPAKACEALGWSRRTGFEEMIREMVEADLHDMRVSVANEGQSS